MARTPSTMIMELGASAPDFTLIDIDDSHKSLEHVAGPRGTLVMFICNHCPFVIHIREELAKLGNDYMDQGVGLVAICSNDVDNYPDDSPEKMKHEARSVGYTFPYLHDESQNVAKEYGAACTPDFFLFDDSRALIYRGQLCDSRPGNDIPVTGEDLRAALDALVAGNPVPAQQSPSLGCNIKWKPGNEPHYA